MLSSRWIVLIGGAFVAGAACGGRTGDELLLENYGGAITGVGGGGNEGGFGGASGGASGGKSAGGVVGVGGRGSGGFGKGSGGSGFCTANNCGACNTCYEACMCGWEFDPSFARTCQVACNGAGGSPGSGGFPNTCESTCTGYGLGGPGFAFNGCCAAQPSLCGWRSDPSSLIQTNGCFAIEGGLPDDQCPRFNNELGCCRSNGFCGLNLDQYGLGCVPFTGAATTKCDGVVSGSGGAGNGGSGNGGSGGKSTGGVPTGGFGGKATGGVPTGGFGNVPSGGAGGGPSPEQCVASARSECEICACKSCFDPFVSCFQDEGCPYILQCVNLTGCTGPDCLNPNTCLDVIDRYGGIGSSAVQLALPLFSCLRGSGCSCGFGF